MSLSEMKLSIIIPVYNVEAYLRKCVDSVLNQDYEDYEIILVDDGSTDASGVICDEYVAKHNASDIIHNTCPIRVIHQSNAGLSAARNAGIAIAKGEYIQFVDSDDFIEPNVLGALMAQIEREQLDVLRFNYQNVRRTADSRYEVYLPNKYPHQVDTQAGVVAGEQYLNERMGYECYASQFIVRKEIVPLFTPGLHFEDVDWLPRMMLAAKRVNATSMVVYDYLIRQGSISHVDGNLEKKRKNVEDFMSIIDTYGRLIAMHPSCEWLRNMRSSMTQSVLDNVAHYFYSNSKAYILRLKAMGVFPLTIANQGYTYKRKARLINISPNMYICLLRIKNRR